MTSRRKRRRQISDKNEARKFLFWVVAITIIMLILGYLYYTR